MKKFGVIVSLVFVLSILAFSFVSAQQILQPLADGAKSFYDVILEPLGKFVLGKNTDNSELFFGKLLLFIVILSIVWLVADKFPLLTGKKKSGFIIALIVAVLSVRYLNADWIQVIILPYTTLGVALTSLIPFIIYFFFVKELPTRSMRKMAWIFAFVVFAGLFIYRDVAVATPGFNPSYVYLITAVLSLLMLWFDGTIQRALSKSRYEDLADIKKIERRAELVEDYDKVQDRYSRNKMSKADANRMIASLKGRAKSVGVDPALFDPIA